MRVPTYPLGVVTLLGLATGSARAQTTYDACYVPTVGALYLIKQTSLPSACLSTGHVAISWSSGGLADGSVTTATLADASVTTAKIADGAVTDAKLASAFVPLEGAGTTTNGFAVTGSLGSGTIPATGPGDRIMWYPKKVAFRVGDVDGTQWDDAAVGTYSTAMGVNTVASGGQSLATGYNTLASGANSTAMGQLSYATGDVSTALGHNTIASGAYSFAAGNANIASAAYAVAMGSNTAASNSYSTAMGYSNTASGLGATTLGAFNTASGVYATAMGSQTIASGNTATAMGANTTAQAAGSLVIGRFNTLTGTADVWITTEPLFVAGNGSSDVSRSNALTLLKNGNMTIAGTLTQNSDIRLKEDVEPLDDALDGVLHLTPLRYRFRPGTGHPTEPQIGLSAQEVQQAFPELVSQDAQGYLSVAYPNLTAVLVRALQEQQAQMGAQQAEIDALRDRLARLEASLAEQKSR